MITDEMVAAAKADFSQSRNDMYWKFYAGGGDGFIRWGGYNDGYWWNNISKKDEWRTKTGKETGRKFCLDPLTHNVMIEEPTNQTADRQ